MKFDLSYEFPGTAAAVDEAVGLIVAEYGERDVSDTGQKAAQDQEIANLAAGVRSAGVDLNDPGQRNAFLVGALGGWCSAERNAHGICRQAGHGLHVLATPFAWAILRLVGRA